jgi:hypothetical protein
VLCSLDFLWGGLVVGRVLSFIRSHILQVVALGVLVLAMGAASKRAVIPMFVAIFRFVWPFLLLWLLYRLVKGRLSRAMKQFQEHMLANLQNQGATSGRVQAGKAAQVLDLCPKCGALEQANHRC